jgi:phosphatidate cytidylyltransferase
MDRTRKLRIITGLIALALVILIIFFLPSMAFFGIVLVILTWAAAEFLKIVRKKAPSAPLGILLVLMPLAAIALAFALQKPEAGGPPGFWMLGGAFFVLLSSALVVLLSRVEMSDAIPAMGILAFGIPYFALPAVSLLHLHQIDPWIAFILVLMVAGGDSGAYFIGSAIGRHRLAPRVSPKKSWEGAAGGLLTSVAVAAVWWQVTFHEVRPLWLVLAAGTAIIAQIGDLIESLFKRGVGIKDSSQVLPGHGGIYDRVDAVLLAAPAFLLGLWLFGLVPHIHPPVQP